MDFNTKRLLQSLYSYVYGTAKDTVDSVVALHYCTYYLLLDGSLSVYYKTKYVGTIALKDLIVIDTPEEVINQYFTATAIYFINSAVTVVFGDTVPCFLTFSGLNVVATVIPFFTELLRGIQDTDFIHPNVEEEEDANAVTFYEDRYIEAVGTFYTLCALIEDYANDRVSLTQLAGYYVYLNSTDGYHTGDITAFNSKWTSVTYIPKYALHSESDVIQILLDSVRCNIQNYIIGDTDNEE